MRKLHIARIAWALALVAVSVFAVTAFAADDGDGKFSLFGNARWVTGGVQPDQQAVDLTSNCGAQQPYSPTCYSNPTFVFSGVGFTLKNGSSLAVADIKTLCTEYNFGGADCGGGSPRFVIFLAGGGGNDNLTGDFGQPPTSRIAFSAG